MSPLAGVGDGAAARKFLCIEALIDRAALLPL
jgi:hypothetical protein